MSVPQREGYNNDWPCLLEARLGESWVLAFSLSSLGPPAFPSLAGSCLGRLVVMVKDRDENAAAAESGYQA